MNETIFMLAIDFIALIGVIVLLLVVTALVAAVVMYQIDKRQTVHTIRRNYPLLGRFRYLFEELG
jgi:NADH:ubiquinone oxidoreductase subunit 6 (subunit J)